MKIKKYLLSAIITVSLAVAGGFADEPLPRGETVIHDPAISDGLCVHAIFQSGMVLQRDKTIPVWGWAEPGEEVTVTLGDNPQTVKAADDRVWKVELPALPASSDPVVMTVKGKEKTITLENILIGDIWVLGGQSNMEFELAKIVDGDLEIVSANFPNIRHITIPQQNGPDYRKSFPRQHNWSGWFGRHFKQGYWEVCSPETVMELSGLGYVFVRRIHMATQIPIGVVDLSRGGTSVETWTPRSVLDSIDTPEVKAMLQQWDEKVAAFDPEQDLKDRISRHEDWVKKMKDQGKDADKPAPSEPVPGPGFDMNRPGNCYASMIAPVAGFPVKGAVFHQGFNNAGGGTDGFAMYYQVFGKMITAWREAFNDPAMPFGIISLCTAGDPQDRDNYISRISDGGIFIREAQYKTFLDFRNAGDKNIGFASSFDQRRSWYHPQIKAPVGERIARWALATQYGKKLSWEPPLVTDVTVEEGKLIVHLDRQVWIFNDGPMEGFCIAGKDGKFQLAEAGFYIKGVDSRNRPQYDSKKIALSSPLVLEPLYFRHAWGRNPLTNLKAEGSIPLATQRNDTWTLEDTYEAYLGKPPAEASKLNRAENGELSKALQAADLERRLYEARELIRTSSEEGEKR